MQKIIAVFIMLFFFIAPLFSEDETEKIFTINTDPLVPFLYGIFYLTLDIKIYDHLILGNAVAYRNANISVIPEFRYDFSTFSYTLGLAYFPFEPRAEGIHIALFLTPTAKFESDHTGFDLLVGSYLGYSIHVVDSIKLSFKVGGMYTDVTDIEDSELLPHLSFEVGYMF